MSALDKQNHHSEPTEKTVLTTLGIVIFIVVAVILYFEWKGKSGH